MAFLNDQTEPMPSNNDKKESINHLPKYFRTNFNKKFLNATVDQLIQSGLVKDLNGFYGRKNTTAFDSTKDLYITDNFKNRNDYQFEPATLVKDELGNLEYYSNYNDLINLLQNYAKDNVNHDVVNSAEYYAWQPHIDFDKFINFSSYYWLPYGPPSVQVYGQTKEVKSTYAIDLRDNLDNFTYVFTPDGLTNNPDITLYRGQTYKFVVNVPNYPIAFVTKISFTPGREYGQETTNTSLVYENGITKLDNDGFLTDEKFIDSGVIEFTVPDNAPDVIYYISKTDPNLAGSIRIFDILENSEIDVEKEIIGKKNYTTSQGWDLSNGMKVNFIGNVFPKKYADGEWFVEGVGESIELINSSNLESVAGFLNDEFVDFDTNGFDTLPFSKALKYLGNKDYITINRSSIDGNIWSNTNRWFHIDVIEKSYEINKENTSINQSFKAARPIIEFNKNLKLFNFGTKNKGKIDLVDDVTTDAFSNIEGSEGYFIDGVELTEGLRVTFLKDTDILVKNRIFKIKFITVNNNKQITLVEDDTVPEINDNITVRNGQKYNGTSFYFNGTTWIKAQQKVSVNQAPLFDCFDKNDISLNDQLNYPSSNFSGNKIFSYEIGNGNNDTELGFPITYKNIENSGDIVFKFDLVSHDNIIYKDNIQLSIYNNPLYIRKYNNDQTYQLVNGFTKVEASRQNVIRQFIVEDDSKIYPIDTYDDNNFINDLWIRVYVNNVLQKINVAYVIEQNVNGESYIRFLKNLVLGSSIILKTRTKYQKNSNGFYEIPANLETNPLNEDLDIFTFGEVLDHCKTIVEETNNFEGIFPGRNNLRDLGLQFHKGRKFCKHSSLFNLYSFNMLQKDFSIIDSISFSQDEYSKFKRNFISTATNLGFDGEIINHFDKILLSLNKNKTETNAFYLSDMLGINGKLINETTIEDVDQIYFGISEDFKLDYLSDKSVLVYKNKKQLIHGKDYIFIDGGFVEINAKKQLGDIISIYEFESTNGSFIPATPTKLGLYPKFQPRLYIDDTVQITGNNILENFKLYGVEENTQEIGWFFPLFNEYQTASDKDVELGGNGEVYILKLEGLSRAYYLPMSNKNLAAQDNEVYNELIIGEVIIQGHDNSKITAFKDYRDNLILELEKRIFNNIKINYDADLFDIYKIIPGYNRKTNISRSNIESIMFADFAKWIKLVNVDFVTHRYFDFNNKFTYNFNHTKFDNGESVPGWWRGIFHYVYDTDRPHTHPWEMLGFSIKPDWWEEQYGKLPYTRNNLELWQDLEAGIIRKPTIKIDKRFIRPNLTKYIPVDEHGNLVNPLYSNVLKNYSYDRIQDQFRFGDYSPVETAWRRSSGYVFSLLKAAILNKPSYVFSVAFDRNRQKRNVAGQIVYSETDNHIKLSDLIFLEKTDTDNVNYCSGLINYVFDYQNKIYKGKYVDYQLLLRNITNQMSFHLGGFTDKEKLKLILDSRTPSNNGNVFVPSENYSINYVESYPIKEIVYSGVIIEKQAELLYIRGYDNTLPLFAYYKVIRKNTDRTLNIGGISESFINWVPAQDYVIGTIVRVNEIFYRVKISHTSTDEFDKTKFVVLPRLPIEGGIDITIPTNFEKSLSYLDYDTGVKSVQDVVDFLLGYGHYLETIGFKFDKFINDEYELADWNHAVKQFVFWCTQNWQAGSIITLSPGAYRLNYYNSQAVVGNTLDSRSGYNILDADGTSINFKDLNFVRDNSNNFIIDAADTDKSIYFAKFPLVLKEHVVLIDNITVFNDTIFDLVPGYRQDRIRVAGYITNNWTGAFNIEGFIYHDATLKQWLQWNDYNTGDLVKYKEFYYIAPNKISGQEFFDFDQWTRLDYKPESKLMANFDYKTEQFNDFYSLDSNNLNVELQQMGQHLIGYQKRQYLENIINNEVSQYKFYQGYIKDKGTKKSLTNLFDVLSSDQKESLEFFEEWAVRVCTYGGIDTYKEFDYTLNEEKYDLKSQPILLTNEKTNIIDNIYRIPSYETYLKYENYDHNPFPLVEKGYTDVFSTTGYVNVKDINDTIQNYEDLLVYNATQLNLYDYIHVINYDKNNWAVLKYIQLSYFIKNIIIDDAKVTQIIITLDRLPKNDIYVGSIVGISTISYSYFVEQNNDLSKFTNSIDVDLFFSIQTIVDNTLTLNATSDFVTNLKDQLPKLPDTIIEYTGILTGFENSRISNFDDITKINFEKFQLGHKIWVDNDDDWQVLNLNEKFNKTNEISLDNFSNITFDVNEKNTILVVGNHSKGDGKVYVYTRASTLYPFVLSQILEPNESSKVEFIISDLNGLNEYVVVDSNFSVTDIEKIFVNGVGITDYTVSVNENKIVFNQTQGFGAKVIIEFSQHAIPYLFGESLKISKDGKFIAIGSPSESFVKTKFVGTYLENQTYETGDIVAYNNLYWTALIPVLPAAESTLINSFYNFNEFLVEQNLDTENAVDVAMLLTGNYPITGSDNTIIADHFLIKLNKEMYDAVQVGDEIVLHWNKFTNANQTQLEIFAREPFYDSINFLNSNAKASNILTDKHIIQEKVECILVLETIIEIELNSRVYSGNAFGYVAYQYTTVDSNIIYLKNVYKVFDQSSILYQDGEILGDYTLALTNEDNLYGNILGHYIKIDVPPYYVGNTVIDNGRGLIVKETITDSTPTNLFYANILDNVNINTNASLIKRFSYNGIKIQQIDPLIPDAWESVDQEYVFRHYAVRLPIGLENLSIGDSFSFYYNQLPKTIKLLKVKNVRFATAPTLVEGEILTQRNTNAFATVFSSVVVEDPNNIDNTVPVWQIQVQFLSQDVSEIIFDFENLLVGSVSGETFLVPIETPVSNIYKSITDLGFSNNTILNNNDNLTTIWDLWDGFIIYRENRFSPDGLPYEPYPKYFENLGNLETVPGRVGQIIREKGTSNTAEVMYLQRLSDGTILVYVGNVTGTWKLGEKTVIDGLSQEATIEMLAMTGINDPYNRADIYNVDRDIGFSIDVSLPTNEIGKLAVVLHQFSIPITAESEIKGEEYWIYKNEIVVGQARSASIPSKVSLEWQEVKNLQYDVNGSPSSYEKEGSLYIYEFIGNIYRKSKQLVLFNRDNNTEFGKDISITSHNEVYKVFSSSNLGISKNINIFKKGIENNILYDWTTSKNPNYRGTYDNNETYFVNDIVLVDNVFYVATSNRNPETFDYAYDLGVWKEADNLIDYTGYLPNNSLLNITFDSVDISTIPLENLFEYGINYAVSKDGEVLVVTVKYTNENTNTLAVYRNLNGYYKWSQNISPPNNSIDFGHSLSLNGDGSILIVSDPKNNFGGFSNGVVFYYKLESSNFVLKQTIYNRYNEAFEKFGEYVTIDENLLLYVYSKNGYQTFYISLDNSTTTFDNNFTSFNTIKDNLGSVSIFQIIGNTFVYSGNLDMQITDVTTSFGEHIITNNNNVYVSLQNLDKIVEFGKKKKELFSILRKPKYPVDLSKIKKINLYDKRTKKVIKELDYIDASQGKIPGPAEQNITFKLPYDPAIYTNANSSEVNQDETMYWSNDHVNEIWWNTKNVKFYHPYQDNVKYSTNYWFKYDNTVDIEIYEWVESDYTPTQWNELSGTPEGISLNITGTANSNYSIERKYNEITKSFFVKYYYWVKNVTVLPSKKGRNLTAAQIKNLLQDPLNENYSFVALISTNEFALFNCKNYLIDDHVAISFQIYTDTITPEHFEYKLLTVDDAQSKIPENVHMNLVDSLVGYDLYGRSVPDMTLSEKYRYGNLQSIRQSWFKDRHKALEIYFNRVNLVLKNYLLIDNKDISNLFAKDEPPGYELNFYDVVVDTYDDLFNSGIGKTEQAEISLVIENGSILEVIVINPGYGYLVNPTYTVIGKGSNLILDFELDTTGSISSVGVVNGGENYSQSTYVVVRKFTALVTADETVLGKWALYEKDSHTSWSRIQTQGFNTNLYWNYIDWYEKGYNTKSKINYVIDYAYQLPGLSDIIGDVVKIKNISNNGWLLLKKINNIANADYTVNYETIGKQNGTIEFSSVLYNVTDALINFDLKSYDTNLYDSIPSIEIRNILNAIKNEIFIDDLAVEYNRLFFALLRYAFYEHSAIDWAFKTNFLKVKHNVGELRNDVTFNNDNLSSYEEYVREVKPFKSKLREFVSVYDTTENASTFIGDFDLSPQYQQDYNKILPYKITVTEDGFYNTESLNTDVSKIWNAYNTYSITEIKIGDGGAGYSVPPKITVTGGGGSGFEAIARLGNNGSITAVDVINPGTGYFSTPRITINGSVAEEGREARLSIILGDQLTRSVNTSIKFDRLSKKYEITSLETSETFVGTNNKFYFILQWPMQLTKSKVSIYFNNAKVLSQEYTITNVLDNSKGYDRYVGAVTFDVPPNANTEIVINYFKDVKFLTAQDRFSLVYSLFSSNLTLADYMDGIDYGGVQVKSILFGSKLGWDTTEYLDTAFDINDEKYNDIVYTVDRHLTYIAVLDRKYVIDFNMFAKLVAAIINGNSNFIAEKINFYTLFNVNYENEPLDNSTAGTSILNVANNTSLSINSANIFQDFGLGLDVDDFDNISQEIIPKFLTFNETQIGFLINEKVLNDVVINFDLSLETGSAYNVYHNNVRIDDPEFVDAETAVNNPNAIMQTIIGDGVQDSFIVQDYITNINANDIIIIRKSISDGSFVPNYENLDTEIQGGLLNYSNAKGIVSNEIVIDGDNFVSPTNSKGPEELLPGLVQDSFAITVYERPNLGGSFIYNLNYIGNGVQTEYDINVKPVSQLSLIVKINNVLYQLDKDYTLNYNEEKVIFVNTPALNDKINILILDYSADDVLDTGVLVADGKTNEFLLNVRWQEDLNGQITVNGKNLDYVLIASDTEYYDSSNNVLIRFSDIIEENAIINYLITFGEEKKHSAIHIDEFIADGSTTAFKLYNAPFAQMPAEWHTLVFVNNKLLNPGYVETFVTTDVTEYSLKLYQIPLGSLSFHQIKVYLNDNELQHIVDWNYTSSTATDLLVDDYSQEGSTIEIRKGLSQPGDILKVYVYGYEDSVESGGDYRFGYFNNTEFISTPDTLYINPIHLNVNDKIRVYQFSNHDSQSIDWQSFDVVERTEFSNVPSSKFDIKRVIDDLIEIKFSIILQANKQYQIFKNGLRIDDLNFGEGQVSNLFASIKTPFGTGTRILNLADIGLTVSKGDVIKVVEIQSDYPFTNTDEYRDDFYEYQKLKNGIIPLNSSAIDAQYVWVVKNGIMLSPSVDYKLGIDRFSVKLVNGLQENDNVQVIHFSNKLFSNKFAWKQFHDILNNTHYTTLNGENNITLMQDLYWYDKFIEVNDGSLLPQPTENSKYPGVIIIDGERIEYYEKTENILFNLRRGTLGTGVKNMHAAGVEIYNQSIETILPYKDEILRTIFNGDGENTRFVLDFIPNNINEFEVFVGGKRLRKNSIASFNPALGQDSPEGDIILPQEFDLENSNELVLLVPPMASEKVTVIRRQGKLWKAEGETLNSTNNAIVQKIRINKPDMPR